MHDYCKKQVSVEGPKKDNWSIEKRGRNVILSEADHISFRTLYIRKINVLLTTDLI